MNRIAVVTGATRGIGKEIARGLLRDGATVVIGARDAEAGAKASRELAAEPGGGRIEVEAVDLSSLASVRSFASRVGERHPKLHLLINNAGAWFNERRESRDGHEATLATNVLGPYLLTNLLLPQLKGGRPGSRGQHDLEHRRRL